jgi:hypothetical protein
MKNYFITTAAILGFVAITMLFLWGANHAISRPSMVLTNDACEAPCWYGIQPGVTTSWEAYEILSAIDVITNNSIYGEYNKKEAVTSYYWFFQPPASDSGGSVHFEDDRVTAISILTVDSLKLKDFIAKFGEPDQYWTEIGYGELREYLEISLFYPTQGYVVNLVIDTEGDSKQAEIKGSSQVIRVTFFEPELMDDLLETSLLIDTPKGARKGSFIPWTGYGMVSYSNQ